MAVIEWQWEDGILPLQLPEDCAVARYAPLFPPPLAEEEQAARIARDVGALADPIRKAREIAVLVEDGSRPTVTGPLVAQLVREIERRRAGRAAAALILAAGAHFHRPSEPELLRKIGAAPRRYFLHDATDDAQLVRIGASRSGIPFWVNRRVAAADLRLAVGTVNIHPLAGFSGGAKILLPGVAGLETITALHNLPAGPPGRYDGPMRRLMNELLGQLPVHFGWQLLSRPDGAITAIYGGPLEEAHSRARAAVRRQAALAGPERPAELILAGCRPFQQNLIGTFKALAQLARLPRAGACLVLFNEARDGRGGHHWRNQPRVVEVQREHYARIYAGCTVAVYSPRSAAGDFAALFPAGFRLLKTAPELRDFLQRLQPRQAALVPYAPLTLFSQEMSIIGQN